jgi:hypothetical protein
MMVMVASMVASMVDSDPCVPFRSGVASRS